MAHRPRISGDTVESLNQLVENEVDDDVDDVGIEQRIQALITKHKRVAKERRRLQLDQRWSENGSETASSGGEQTEYHPPSADFMDGV